MRKPVISNEISLKFDEVPTTDTLPVSQLTENIVYKMHITLFSVLSTPEIHSKMQLSLPSSAILDIKSSLAHQNSWYVGDITGSITDPITPIYCLI